jgi:DNA-binding NarL/FixJ family response regulator
MADPTASGVGMEQTKRRIVVVDDHPLVREGLTRLIAETADMSVCGEAANACAALDLIRTVQPHAAIVDLVLPDGDGLELVNRLAAHFPRLKILVCSMRDAAVYAERAFHAGAHGYVGKHEAVYRIVEALQQVLAGRHYAGARQSETAVCGFEQRPSPSDSGIGTLTDRELAVFALIGRGLTTGKVAAHLHISVKTVEAHREHIKRKLRIRSGKQLERIAIEWDLRQS